MNFTNKNMDNLIKTASKKLGTDPQALKKQIDSGNLEDIMKSLSPAQTQGLQQILNNPMLAQKLMDSPQAKEMIKKLTNK